jgi:hypothetical protein
MNNQLPTVIFLLPSVLRIFTTVESALQIRPFMQNKPNFRKAKMNVSDVYTKEYENVPLCRRGQNKPNTNPIQSQTKPNKANLPTPSDETNPIQTQYTNPIQTQSNPISKQL